MSEPTKKCLNPACEQGVSVRGLCGSCYTMAAKLVRSKLTTWDRLQKEGKVSGKRFPNGGAKKWLLS